MNDDYIHAKECASLFVNGTECPEPRSCVIKGNIPGWIEGSFLRNGPGEYTVGKETYKHWFDGHALIHRFHLEKGRVSYMSKFLKSEVYNLHSKYKRIIRGGMGNVGSSDPTQSFIGRSLSKLGAPKPSDNCNVNLWLHGGKVYALTDSPILWNIDPVSLGTIGESINMTDKVGAHLVAAHPHTDAAGTMYNIASMFGSTSYYAVIKFIPGSENLIGASVVTKIEMSTKISPSYLHSFALSSNFIGFIELPLRMHVLEMMGAQLRNKTMFDAMKFHKDQNTQFHFVNKDTGTILNQKYLSEAFIVTHHINMYEEEGYLLMDVLCYHKVREIFNELFFSVLNSEGEGLKKALENLKSSTGMPYRFAIPLHLHSVKKGENIIKLPGCSAEAVLQNDGSVFLKPEPLFLETWPKELITYGLEYPRINYSFNGEKYRFFYACGRKCFIGKYLVKIDVVTKEVLMWSEEGSYASEPVFVPCACPRAEDDGVLLSVVMNTDKVSPTFLLVLNATTMQEIGRAEIDVAVPPAQHHLFVPA